MARTSLNSALRMLSGEIDGFVYRHQPDGSVTVAKKLSPRPDRPRHAAQVRESERFRDAAARCQILLQDPAIKAGYEQIMTRRSPMSRLRAVVIGDVLKPPDIRRLDLSRYQGGAGQTIRLYAQDNVAVARLALVIYDLTADRELEADEKPYPPERLRPVAEWSYTTQRLLPPGHLAEVRASAWDLAGNKTDLVQPVTW